MKTKLKLYVNRLGRGLNVIGIYFIIFAIVPMLTSCSSDELDELEPYVKSVKSRPAGTIKPLPEIVVYEAYSYASNSQRDPFKASFTSNKVSPRANLGAGGPDLSRERTPLELYPLDSLAYIGSLQQNSNMWGLIKTPDGSIARVQVGVYVGQNYGRITSIDDSGIELLELISDGIGGWEKRIVMLTLKG